MVFHYLPVYAMHHMSRNYTTYHVSSCPYPGGTLIAGYNDGYHAIVGNNQLLWGSDYVYNTANDSYTQCYCPLTSSKGIQTNWLSSTNISMRQRNALINKGWNVVPDGSVYGLISGEYLAQNSYYFCR